MARVTKVSEDNTFRKLLREKMETDGGTLQEKVFSIFIELLGDASFVLQWVEDNFEPSDIFDVDVLEKWASNNGYSRNEQ